ncbi:hypothetical protein BD310DRAFT_938853 [Dichomitus squalens]|uniref:Uncharacterized protein n=1 Tax=Dichomitus squalens TaxID=114155 RepID=A0A4Q9PHD4_9APHY|nr:hypothetical protein BD310DRAFT_938853 [Dichomitus squalens]
MLTYASFQLLCSFFCGNRITSLWIRNACSAPNGSSIEFCNRNSRCKGCPSSNAAGTNQLVRKLHIQMRILRGRAGIRGFFSPASTVARMRGYHKRRSSPFAELFRDAHWLEIEAPS